MTQNTFKEQSKRLKFHYIPYIMFGAGLVFFFIYRNSKKDTELLQRSGIVVEATIIDKDISTSDEYGDKYYLSYAFTYKEKEYSDENKVYEELYRRKEINDTVKVRILMNDPDISQIYSDLVFPEQDDYLLITMIMFITGFMFIIIPNYKRILNFFKKKEINMQKQE